VFFGFWQLRDLNTPYSWNYANILASLISWGICVGLTVWVVYLSVKYKGENVPKKYGFVLGEDSFLPFEMPIRHIRKLLFCIFLATGLI
jgi:hypothetical protein